MKKKEKLKNSKYLSGTTTTNQKQIEIYPLPIIPNGIWVTNSLAKENDPGDKDTIVNNTTETRDYQTSNGQPLISSDLVVSYDKIGGTGTAPLLDLR